MLIVPVQLLPSPIHGLGVFSAGFIAGGRVVSEYRPPFDVEFAPEVVARLSDAERAFLRVYAYRSRFTGTYFLTGDHDRFMNHSDNPNVAMNPNGNFNCLAVRDIADGEELTCDYRTFDADWQLKLAPE
jgi:hypothetical protein